MVRSAPRSLLLAAAATAVVAIVPACSSDRSGTAAALADRIPASPPTRPGYQDVARQTRYGDPLPDSSVAAVSAVRAAALDGDVEALVALCVPCRDRATAQQQRQALSPALMRELARILLTHPETTDGLTYPGSALGDVLTDLDRADQAFLAPDPPSLSTTFEAGEEPGLQLHWQGAWPR